MLSLTRARATRAVVSAVGRVPAAVSQGSVTAVTRFNSTAAQVHDPRYNTVVFNLFLSYESGPLAYLLKKHSVIP